MRLWSLSCSLFIAAGCYPSETFEERPCTSSTQCERGTGCRVSTGSCIELPPNSLLGGFTCTVGDGTAPLEIGGSDVTGNFDDVDVSLIAGQGCTLHPNGSLDLALAGLRPRLTVLGIETPTPGRHPFNPFSPSNSTIGVYGPEGSGLSVPAQAFVSGGFVELDRAPVMGQELRVYFEAFLEAPVTNDAAGVPCPRGQVDCGGWPFSRTYCAALDVQPLCLADCATASDCSAYGANTCDGGMCFRSCTSNAGCESPLECATLSSGARVCL